MYPHHALPSPSGLLRAALVVSAAATLASAASLAEVGSVRAQETPGAGTVTLSGRVVRAESARPVPDARVDVVEREISVLTDDLGRFEIRGLAPGTVTLRVSFLGGTTTERTVELRAGEPVDLRIAVGVDVLELEGVDVTAARPAPKPLELFARRYERGGGRVITREEVEAHDGLLSSLVREHNPFGPGTKMRRLKSASHYGLRSGGSLGGGASGFAGVSSYCEPQRFVNGRRADWLSDEVVMFGADDLDYFRPDEVSVVEIYPPEALPSSLATEKSRACGAIVLWELDYIMGLKP